MTLTRHPLLSIAMIAAFVIAGALLVEAIVRIGSARGDAGVVAVDAGTIDAGPVASPAPPTIDAPLAPTPAVASPDATAAAVTWDALVSLARGGQLGAALAIGLHIALGRLALLWPLLQRVAPGLATGRRLALVSALSSGVAVVVPLALAGQPVMLALVGQAIAAVALWLWPAVTAPPSAPPVASP